MTSSPKTSHSRRSPTPEIDELDEMSAWYDMLQTDDENILNWFTPKMARVVCQDVIEFAQQRNMPCEKVVKWMQILEKICAQLALDLVEAGLMADAKQDGERWKKAKTAINVLGNLLLAESLDNNNKVPNSSAAEEDNVQEEHKEERMRTLETLTRLWTSSSTVLKLPPQTYVCFKLPFVMIISGPSSSGKTEFLLKFIAESDQLITPKPISILYCVGEMNAAVPALQKAGVDVYAGVPSEELVKRLPKPLLLILDDLMLSIDEKYLSDLFTKKSHHQQFAVVFITQNWFERKIKVARLSAQYLVLMRAPNSLLSIRHIGVQLFPRKLDFFLDAYRKATARPYGYLLIDMHAASDPSLRLRTNIFKDEQEDEDEGTVVFIPKNGAA
ncbi:hypothetical protein niasHT_028444 [Heterodera trifolii]|uniref:AAA+ ATPase domain-containing protein n=1 Tax=Heterodera trifolii TaxID=157864 RepID=A0ABD2KPN3_9BILA